MGRVEGGKKCAAKLKAKDPDYYRKLGKLGGRYGAKDGVTKGFALNRERARRAGRIGGSVSKRKKKEKL